MLARIEGKVFNAAMHIEEDGVWLTADESLHLEVMAREYEQEDLWEAIRLGNINWLDKIVPDAGFETPLSYEHRFIARWMRACRLQADVQLEPICVSLTTEQIRSLGALISTALERHQDELENFDEYMDRAEKEAQEAHRGEVIPGITDVTEEEKQMHRNGEFKTLVRDVSMETKLASIIDWHLQGRD
jgi:hypothetical protein